MTKAEEILEQMLTEVAPSQQMLMDLFFYGTAVRLDGKHISMQEFLTQTAKEDST